MPNAHPQRVIASRLIPYNEANPVRKQDPVSPAHALIQKVMWPRIFLMVMFLYRNPGATKQGICDRMKLPLWKVQQQFHKMKRSGLLTRRHVGVRFYRYYLTREAFLIARMVVEIEQVLSDPEQRMDSEE